MPRQRFLRLVALPESVCEARAHVRGLLEEWGRADLVDAAEMVASELASNAVKATQEVRRSRPVGEAGRRAGVGVMGLSVYQVDGLVVVEMWDCTREPPRLLEAGPDAESGRGLWLVDALSAGWGYRRPKTGGKVVYATLEAGL
ncbi:hypothetical protein Aple_050470 [Acrocarpospora pleiomorpha]|uniref:Histidine kinase/HSP90-like ATPase domain-containing protein n=1 Tax=Acrocarpospora pleiomorpha TaxID=90975 RepID=A0A5M3XMH0_9ACTN|nr:ATP-binding protein [Acrocarpospora pleiomorpha]GES22150.1 hypothetical protein Aple_050470 [Acrocarpospora pleiomorpha]